MLRMSLQKEQSRKKSHLQLQQKNKIPRSKLTKEVNDYKILMKEVEEDTNKWKGLLCSWIRRINIVKMLI